MFVISDALQFAGLLPDKKKVPARDIRLAMHKFKFLSEKSEELSKEIANIEQWNKNIIGTILDSILMSIIYSFRIMFNKGIVFIDSFNIL